MLQRRNATLAGDAALETLLAALQSGRTLPGRSSVRTWRVGIAKDEAIDAIRKRVRGRPRMHLRRARVRVPAPRGARVSRPRRRAGK